MSESYFLAWHDYSIFCPLLPTQGFGKRLVRDSKVNQHYSHHCISWDDAPHPSYSSTYKAGYGGKERDLKNYAQSTQRADASLLKKFHTPLKSNFRHFPRNHRLPEDPANTKPTTHTTNWFGDKTHRTPLFVLAATQQPFVKLNPWKFSY